MMGVCDIGLNTLTKGQKVCFPWTFLEAYTWAMVALLSEM